MPDPTSKPDRSDPIEDLPTLERPPGASTPRPAQAARGGPALSTGQVFGSYRLGRLLGKGAFGQVWEAESADHGRRIALKVLAVADASPEMLQRFDREGRLAASLNHPHCVYVLAAERIEGSPTIAMELMPGGTLQDVLKARGALPVAEAVDRALEVLEGLEAAHAAGILHRDLKPSNCFLDEHGRAKIGDFGLSKTLDFDAQLTTEGSFMGTPAYAPPEQVRGTNVDARSDLYSLGATLYALLCGKPPHEGKDLGGVLSRILTEEPKPLSAHGVSVPKGLQAAVQRLLQKDPAKRHQGHAAVRAALVPYSSLGLSAVELPRRYLAFLADSLLISTLEIPLSLLVLADQGLAVGLLAGLAFGLRFVYFYTCEAFWGRTPGKALFGLRVTSATGGGLSHRQVLVRTAVFLGLFKSDLLLKLLDRSLVAETPAGISFAVATGVFALALTFLPLVSMRKRNGFAGLHDLASRTRVQVVRAREVVRVPKAPPAAAPAPGGPRSFGPYEEAGVLWETPGEGLLLAHDPVLRRPVWVHHYADPSRARPAAELAAWSYGRLRFLQGRREPGASWDAYEAPSGTSLVDWVRGHGGLSWREAREVLLGVSRALEPGAAAGDAQRALALDRVWVDAAPGHARIADFPVAAAAEGALAETTPPDAWRAFLRRVTRYALEGLATAADRAGEPRTGFPEHARPLLARLGGAGPEIESPTALTQELEALRRRPAEITRRQRLFTLALPGAVPALILGMAFLVRMVVGVLPAWTDFLQFEKRIDALRALQGKTDPASVRQREAIRLLLGSSYEKVKTEPRVQNILAQVPADVRKVMEDAARDYPAPTEAELAEARQRSGLPDIRGGKSAGGANFSVSISSEDSPTETARDLMRSWAIVATCALALSLVFRGGVLFFLTGLTVQRVDGRRAGFFRRSLRAAVAWTPLLLFYLGGNPFGPPKLLLLAVLTAAFVYGIVRPDRGVPDLLAGTRLVPR